MDELKSWLEANGFRTANNSVRDMHNRCHWYAYRRSSIPARECETNEGKACQIVVNPYTAEFQGKTLESVEVEVCGEASGIWWKLQAYSLTPDELRERLPEIEQSLIQAWNSLIPDALPSHDGKESGGGMG